MIDKEGGDFVSGLDSTIKKIGFKGLPELHLYTTKGKKYSYCGPGTDLDKRLNSDGTPKPGYEPINKIDQICLHHDYNYSQADIGVGTRHEADKIMLEELNALNDKDLNWNEWFAKKFTKGAIGLKYKLGFGLPEDIQMAEELHRPIRSKFKRRRVLVYNVDDIWSADLMDMQSFSKQNKGFKYLLNIIDIFSKVAYSIPLKSKSQQSIVEAFEKLFTKTKPPKRIWVDQGKEFWNKTFRQLLDKHNIVLYHVYNEGKATVVERLNRSLGEMIQKHMTATKSKNYINVLQKLINDYNHRYHSSIKMTPVDAQKTENRNEVLQNLYVNPSQLHSVYENLNPKTKPLVIGDRVRIYKYKKHFEKGRTTNWTTEIFQISEVLKTNPITYRIQDLNGEPILGSFYTQEMQKTKF